MQHAVSFLPQTALTPTTAYDCRRLACKILYHRHATGVMSTSFRPVTEESCRLPLKSLLLCKKRRLAALQVCCNERLSPISPRCKARSRPCLVEGV